MLSRRNSSDGALDLLFRLQASKPLGHVVRLQGIECVLWLLLIQAVWQRILLMSLNGRVSDAAFIERHAVEDLAPAKQWTFLHLLDNSDSSGIDTLVFELPHLFSNTAYNDVKE